MILPVVLAMTLGALRVQSELRDASRLSIAADDSDIVLPRSNSSVAQTISP
ncbi:hypothetical protein [Antrihabitans spumae]|uniref:Uncharacterized protein n=1 Tax=Antrihabitans spumae TaxID=3373370 RepID=A0ABW7K868_9NOCA